MILIFYSTIFILGLLFGSFATVLITRWHEHENGILLGRSRCPKCHHTLSWYELFPVFSYLFLRGKCRKCKNTIPFFYPLSELIMGGIFLCMTFVYLRNGSDFSNPQFILLLALGFITGVYVLSDLRYMEIPDEIMVPGIYGYILLLIVGFYGESLSQIFLDRTTYGSYSEFVWDHILGAVVIYTFFYLQILIPATIQLSKKHKWSEIGDICLSYFTFPYFILFPPKNTEHIEKIEEPLKTWVGGGDLRIALFIGITLGTPHAIFALFVAYFVGSFVGIIIMLFYGRKVSQVPFGPFLAIGWCIALFYHPEVLVLVEYYKSLF